ncbi:MAG TPA: hypothetical protein VGX68_25910 [Thermoanaerobaculia bacterium]|jgi:hypothetical protein|nr:hypothetical protein [Thermoanaerobaculia bacterium]
MKRLAQIFKNRTFPLTVLALLALAVGYYLFHVRGREAYFTHRYLRLLAFESGRLEERLANLDAIFANYQKDGTLRAADLAAGLKDIPAVERLERPPADFQVPKEAIAREGRIEGDRFRVYAGWRQRFADLHVEEVAFRFDPFALAQPGLPEDFETLFVATRDGTVLYQKTQNGGRQLRIVNVRKLLGDDGKELDLAAFAHSTSKLDVRFAGESYKLFLRPCCRAIWRPSAERPSKPGEGSSPTPQVSSTDPLEWVIGGAVRSSTLSGRCWAISFTVGILVVALFVLALLSLSFLRVLAIGPKEKLRVADALGVGFTAIMGVGLLTLLLLDLHAYRALIDGTDARLAALAGNVKENLNAELVAAWKQLGSFNARVEERMRALRDAKGKPVEIKDYAGFRAAGIAPRESLLAGQGPAVFSYSDFERFTWVDNSGRQCFKWALAWPGDPLVGNVLARRYFQDALDRRDAIEPVFSMATGTRVAVLAKRTGDFVGVLGIELSSLNGPVLPPGYGFAVIDDQSGDVLFHSDRRRAGYENFFEEADYDRGLRALVAARRSGVQNAAYLGRGHRLRVEPIVLPGSASRSLEHSPYWTLVVFSDKRDMRTFNVDAMTTAMLLLVLYLLVYMAGCGLLRAVKRRYRAGWLWPEQQGEEKRNVHLVLTVFYLLCLILALIAFRLLDGLDLLWFAFAFPWAVLVVSYRLCAGRMSAARSVLLGAALMILLLLIYLAPGSRPELLLTRHDLREPARSLLLPLISLLLWSCFFLPAETLRSMADSPRRTYLAAAALLLALTAAVPAAAFFCIAHRAHLETRIKGGQLGLALARELRDERLKQHYDALTEPRGPDALLNKRLGESWDLYDGFYFSTASTQIPGELRTGNERQTLRAAKAAVLPVLQSERPGDEGHHHCIMLPNFIQGALPLYTEDFIRVRRLIEDHDQSDDAAWDWDHAGERLSLNLASMQLTSTIPRVSLAGFPMLWPVSLLFLTGSVVGVARFVARKFFLYGLSTPEAGDPMSVASASTQNFILVSPHIDEMAQRLAGENTAVIDLRELASREDLLRCLERSDLVARRRICLHHFEHRLQEEGDNLLKLGLLEELILGRDKPVIILSHVVPAWYLLDRKPAPAAEDAALDPDKAAKRQEAAEKSRKEIQERWRGLLRRFLTWVCRNRANVHRLHSDLSAIQDANVLPDGSLNARRQQRLLALAQEECGESEQLESLAGDLVRARLQDLSRDLFLDDLKERAEPYYRALWTMCTEEEKVVLVHLAEGGLINAKNAGALKMLMRRGLIKRDPTFRLMNESFRRFVATDVRLGEVRTLEQEADTSAWGRMKGPLTVTLVGVAAFFFITQREVFDISIAFLSAIAASLPALFRVFGGAVPPAQSKSAV